VFVCRVLWVDVCVMSAGMGVDNWTYWLRAVCDGSGSWGLYLSDVKVRESGSP